MGSSFSNKHDKLSGDDVQIHNHSDIVCIIINGQSVYHATKRIKARKDGKIKVTQPVAMNVTELAFPARTTLCRRELFKYENDTYIGYEKTANRTNLYITKKYDNDIQIINHSNRKLTVHHKGVQSHIPENAFGKYDNVKQLQVYTHLGNKINFAKQRYDTGYFYSLEPQKIDELCISYDSTDGKFVVTNI
jgi:hypothetical protein